MMLAGTHIQKQPYHHLPSFVRSTPNYRSCRPRSVGYKLTENSDNFTIQTIGGHQTMTHPETSLAGE